MVLASVLMAFESVMEKRVYQEVPFVTGLMWLSVGALLTTIAIMAFASTSRARLHSVFSGRIGPIVFANEVLNLVAAWSLSFATSLGPVALVTAVGGLQPVFVLLFQGAARRQHLSRVDFARLVGSCALAVSGLRLLHSSS
jgi:drug/metabolite transporter (DMT)-like permease